MLESANGKPFNTSHLLNINDIMAINPSLLPTIDESFYTNLVSRNNNRTQIVVQIPEEVDDAYTLGDQYVQRLMNDGTLPRTFKQRNIKRNTHSFDPNSFKLTAYDCDNPTDIKNLQHRPDGDCLRENENMDNAESVFTVIHETNTRHHNGYRCVMLETRRTYQCGGFDHSINLDDLTYENRPMRVPEEMWERMAYRREF